MARTHARKGLQSPRQVRQALRWELVHAAGCTEPFCATKQFYVTFTWPDMQSETISEVHASGVRVPRTLAKYYR
jgi:hypothetical protein